MVKPTFSKTEHGRVVTWQCPWCDTTVTAPMRLDGLEGGFWERSPSAPAQGAWTVALCPRQDCRRPTLFCGKTNLKAANEGELKAQFPGPMPTYAPVGVPASIANDFQEAKRCAAHGFYYGAALVGRRALQAGCREKVGEKRRLQDEIDATDLPPDIKSFAHEVRFIGNDAAHCDQVTEQDCNDLLEFAEQVLDILFVKPAKLAARRTSAPSP